MRLSASITSVLAGVAFAAPTNTSMVKAKDVATHLSPLHLNATESLSALLKAFNETCLSMHTFTATVDQHCDKSEIETMMEFSPVLDWRDDTIKRPFPDF